MTSWNSSPATPDHANEPEARTLMTLAPASHDRRPLAAIGDSRVHVRSPSTPKPRQTVHPLLEEIHYPATILTNLLGIGVLNRQTMLTGRVPSCDT